MPPRGRWYLHCYYPEMPDLDWRNPDVVAAMQDVVRFWLERGVDGFRLDAIQGLMKDPEMRDDPPADSPFGLPLPEEYGRLDHVHSTDSPDMGTPWPRCATPRATPRWSARSTCPPTTRPVPGAPGRGVRLRAAARAVGCGALRAAITANAGGGAAWVLSNHDFPRVPTRVERRTPARPRCCC